MIDTIINLLTIPFAIYGVYVFLGLPVSDKITAVGAKTLAWVLSKFRG